MRVFSFLIPLLVCRIARNLTEAGDCWGCGRSKKKKEDEQKETQEDKTSGGNGTKAEALKGTQSDKTPTTPVSDGQAVTPAATPDKGESKSPDNAKPTTLEGWKKRAKEAREEYDKKNKELNETKDAAEQQKLRREIMDAYHKGQEAAAKIKKLEQEAKAASGNAVNEAKKKNK